MADIGSEFIQSSLSELCAEFKRNNNIDPSAYEKFGVKRGLRNADGTGVMAGLTLICNVHGFRVVDGERLPEEGVLTYRGIDLNDIIAGCERDDRFGYEEVCYLLLFGKLPTRSQLDSFCQLLSECRELPQYFAEDMIIKAPSKNVMNKLSRSVLALYSYDSNPDSTTIENIIRQSIMLIAQLPTIMTYAYQVKRRHYDRDSMFFHPLKEGHNTAEAILRALRIDRKFTHEEAKLLDTCLMAHAEHGGGNNSTFACRVLSSSGTDTYSAIAAAIGALKGPKHGGANVQVCRMMEEIRENVRDWKDDDEVSAFLAKLIRGEAGDGSGLVYGMGHAIYTLSDPRARILKTRAKALAEKKGKLAEFELIESVERLTPEVFAKVKNSDKVICANVDLYSGMVYETLGIDPDLYTPLFAVSRIAGWCAHRVEEIAVSGGRIMRPAYKALSKRAPYVDIENRG